jgi:hypothetical protein
MLSLRSPAASIASLFTHKTLNGGGEEPDKRLVAVDFGPEEATLGEAES